MKLTLTKSTLEQLVTTAARATNPRAPMPILSHVLLTARDGTLTATGTDLDVGVEISTEAEVESPGSVAIPAGLLSSIVKGLPTGTVTLEQEAEGRVTLTCGQSRFELSSVNGEDYPALQKPEDGTEATLPADAFVECVKRTMVAAASVSDESRAVMTGIAMTANAFELMLVATDGRRLAVARSEIIGSEDLNAVIPSAAYREIVQHLRGQNNVSLSLGRTQAVFSTGRVKVFSRLLDGRFPDHGKVVPKQFSRTARVGKDDLVSAVKRLLVVAQEKRSPNLLRFNFGDDTLRLTANTPDLGSGEEVLPIAYEGDPLMIGFNGKYVLDGLGALDCDEVQIDLQEETKSAVIRPLGDASYDYVVMPVKLRDVAVEQDEEAA